STGTPTRYQLLVKRIAHRAERRVLGRTAHREFVQVGFADNDRSGLFELFDDRRGVWRNVAAQNARAARRANTGYAPVGFDGDLAPRQRSLFDQILNVSVHRGGQFQGRFAIDRDVRVEPVVISFDSIKRVAANLTRFRLARSVEFMKFGDSRIHHYYFFPRYLSGN